MLTRCTNTLSPCGKRNLSQCVGTLFPPKCNTGHAHKKVGHCHHTHHSRRRVDSLSTGQKTERSERGPDNHCGGAPSAAGLWTGGSMWRHVRACSATPSRSQPLPLTEASSYSPTHSLIPITHHCLTPVSWRLTRRKQRLVSTASSTTGNDCVGSRGLRHVMSLGLNGTRTVAVGRGPRLTLLAAACAPRPSPHHCELQRPLRCLTSLS